MIVHCARKHYNLCYFSITGTEFVLHFILRDFTTNQMKHAKLLFRAPNMEQKFTWKSLLEQKVMSAGGSLQLFSSMSDCSETGVLI